MSGNTFCTLLHLYTKLDSRVYSVRISAWDGLTTGISGSSGGTYGKCDAPDPKLLVRRPVRITLGLKSSSEGAWKRRIGRSLKSHGNHDGSKVNLLFVYCCSMHSNFIYIYIYIYTT